MATNRDLLKEAIADAKAVKETAIANAKAALEEAFTPYLKEKLSAKLAEMDNDEVEENDLSEAEEKMDEMKKEEDMTEEVSLDELLAELEEETTVDEAVEDKEADVYEAKKEEEEMSIEDMSEDDLKSFIEDVIKDMVSAGELEAGEGEETDEEAPKETDMEADVEIDMEAEEELDEEFNIDELLAEMENSSEQIEEVGSDVYLSSAEALIAALSTLGIIGAAALSVDEIRDALKTKGKDFGAWLKDKIGMSKSKEVDTKEMEEQLDELRNELNEVNLLNAKLLYTNKIFRNKSLTESQKIKVLTTFDKATSKKEVELVYESLLGSLKSSTLKTPIKESLGSASKALGNAASKPIIEDDAFAHMRELAFGHKK